MVALVIVVLVVVQEEKGVIKWECNSINCIMCMMTLHVHVEIATGNLKSYYFYAHFDVVFNVVVDVIVVVAGPLCFLAITAVALVDFIKTTIFSQNMTDRKRGSNFNHLVNF